MIHPHELMIGNYIKSAESSNPWKVRAEDFRDISDSPYIYDPIPLTARWLQKLGFTRKSGRESYEWKKSPFGFVIIDLSHNDKQSYLIGIAECAQHLNFVHELQQAFYFATRQSLTLSE